MTYERHWHKRVPPFMTEDYIAKGWTFWGTEGDAVVLVWLHEDMPA